MLQVGQWDLTVLVFCYQIEEALSKVRQIFIERISTKEVQQKLRDRFFYNVRKTTRNNIRQKNADYNVDYLKLLVAARKAEDERSSKSSAEGKYGKAKTKVAQVTGCQASDQSILKKLQQQSRKHQELIKLLKSQKSLNVRGKGRGGRGRGIPGEAGDGTQS